MNNLNKFICRFLKTVHLVRLTMFNSSHCEYGKKYHGYFLVRAVHQRKSDPKDMNLI